MGFFSFLKNDDNDKLNLSLIESKAVMDCLYLMAKADGVIHPNELLYFVDFAKKHGIPLEEIKQMESLSPEEIFHRLKLLYPKEKEIVSKSLFKMMNIDGDMAPEERRLLSILNKYLK